MTDTPDPSIGEPGTRGRPPSPEAPAQGGRRGARHTQGRPEWIPTGDGRRLYAMVLDGPPGLGAAAPTVVFEAGAAAGRWSWALVQPLVGEFARAIVYDRSGLGRSGPDREGRTLRRMAGDLGGLLDHFGPGPFVLVGHSAGGPVVRAAAAAAPDRIAGLVLVDPTDEAADVLFRPAFRRAERAATVIGGLLARARLFGPLYRLAYRSTLKALPDDARRDLEEEGFTLQVVKTQGAQARTFLDELLAFRADPPELGAIPVTVVSGARAGDGMSAKARAAANASHAHRAARSADGLHLLADRSGHLVPFTDPAVIAEAVRHRAGGGRPPGRAEA